METLPEHFYKAFYARDPRYDGLFFTGVTSTGIYCRPVCRARKPKRENCRMFPSAAQAEACGYRPCLICRPELAPHNERTDYFSGNSTSDCVGERQHRRRFKQQTGITPKQWQSTQQLLLAKQLLTETNLSVTEIAFSAGFTSLRRFNQKFKDSYQLTPTDLRKQRQAPNQDDWLVLTLAYRPPYHWQQLLDFLRLRQAAGVEHTTHNRYCRSVLIENIAGEIQVSHLPKQNALQLSASPSLAPVIGKLLQLTRQVFDTGANPLQIAQDLANTNLPGDFTNTSAGLRVPGSFCAFELAVRAIIGQQVTVKAATTLSQRLSNRFCLSYEGRQAEITHLPIQPQTLATATVDDIASLGIIARRAQAIIEIARQVDSGVLNLSDSQQPQPLVEQLQTIPGIGPWTANYIAMRALSDPDAFPKEDIALRKALGGVTAKQAELLSQPWRPWRSYACLHLWNTLNV